MSYVVYTVRYDTRQDSTSTDGAVRTLVPVTSPPRPPPERANVSTYDSWGKKRL
jgi:hypothetical protein